MNLRKKCRKIPKARNFGEIFGNLSFQIELVLDSKEEMKRDRISERHETEALGPRGQQTSCLESCHYIDYICHYISL